jgi:hypothetical protein
MDDLEARIAELAAAEELAQIGLTSTAAR